VTLPAYLDGPAVEDVAGPCVWCDGTGFIPATGVMCRACGGTGKTGKTSADMRAAVAVAGMEDTPHPSSGTEIGGVVP
jgi:RecJ-like exonuclease